MDAPENSVDSPRRRPIRLVTVLLVVLIVVLGYALSEKQRRTARLQAALTDYRAQSHGEMVQVLGGWAPLAWPDDTPLDEVIEEIRAIVGRRSPSLFKDAPIYVDPDALRQAGKTLKSAVKAPPSDDDGELTFRQKLRAVFEPMGLACRVKDGSIVITSRGSADEPTEGESSR